MTTVSLLLLLIQTVTFTGAVSQPPFAVHLRTLAVTALFLDDKQGVTGRALSLCFALCKLRY